ncbi:hypothetical protein UlMin_029327 [Ulmus minor]
MQGSSMERGESATKPLLVKEKVDKINGGLCSSVYEGELLCESSSSSSSATFVLILSTFVAATGSYAFGNAAGYSSPTESAIIKDLGLTLVEYSLVCSIVTIGGMFGAILSGKIGDVIGRRGAMGVAELFCIAGWLAIVFATGDLSLEVGRFLIGCGAGLSAFVIPTYVAEIAPKNIRGTIMVVTLVMLSCGKAVFFLVGSLVSWRTLALIGVVPCLLQLIGLLFIPESPRWLMKIGRVKESEAALQRLRGDKADISQEIDDIKEYTEHCRKSSGDGIRSLFQKKYARCLIIGVGVLASQSCGGLIGISSYTSAILQSAGFPSKIGIIVVGLVQVLMTIIGAFLIDKFGRRPLLLISAAGTCLGCVLVGLSFFLQGLQYAEELSPVLAFTGVVAFYTSFGLGLEGIPWLVASEVFPINIKGSAGSLANLVSWTSSFIVAYSFNFIFEWSSAGTFFIFAGINAASVLFFSKMMPETNGRTLEELQASITQ